MGNNFSWRQYYKGLFTHPIQTLKENIGSPKSKSKIVNTANASVKTKQKNGFSHSARYARYSECVEAVQRDSGYKRWENRRGGNDERSFEKSSGKVHKKTRRGEFCKQGV